MNLFTEKQNLVNASYVIGTEKRAEIIAVTDQFVSEQLK